MCMMLYLGASKPLQLRHNPSLALEAVPDSAQVVREQVRRDYVYFVGSHSGCSCGFPNVLAEQEIQYFDGLFDDGDFERDQQLESVRQESGPTMPPAIQ